MTGIGRGPAGRPGEAPWGVRGSWRQRDNIDRSTLIGAGSVFPGLGTGLGPILVGYG